jgi:hypothetical protein
VSLCVFVRRFTIIHAGNPVTTWRRRPTQHRAEASSDGTGADIPYCPLYAQLDHPRALHCVRALAPALASKAKARHKPGAGLSTTTGTMRRGCEEAERVQHYGAQVIS